MTDDATMNEQAGPYAGLTREECRERILADLEAAGDLVGRRRPRDGHRALPAQRRHRRAAPQDAVVHRRQAHGRAGHAGRPRAAHALRAGALREGLLRLAGEHLRLERQPPAVVGPPHPGLVLPGRPRHGQRRGGRARALCGTCRVGRAAPGRGHLRHLVLERPVAVLDARLAGAHARPARRTTRRRSWRPATTSSSSGWPA